MDSAMAVSWAPTFGARPTPGNGDAHAQRREAGDQQSQAHAQEKTFAGSGRIKGKRKTGEQSEQAGRGQRTDKLRSRPALRAPDRHRAHDQRRHLDVGRGQRDAGQEKAQRMGGRIVGQQEDGKAGSAQVDGQTQETDRPERQVVAAEQAEIVRKNDALGQRDQRSREIEDKIEYCPIVHAPPSSVFPGMAM